MRVGNKLLSWLCCLFPTSPFFRTIVGLLELLIMLFLVQVITSPETTLTAITMEAYKKFVLVSLIQTGQVSSSLLSFVNVNI